eukprot:scaffold12106_cov56-Cyclotella_meneghiniana.AAC.2
MDPTVDRGARRLDHSHDRSRNHSHDHSHEHHHHSHGDHKTLKLGSISESIFSHVSGIDPNILKNRRRVYATDNYPKKWSYRVDLYIEIDQAFVDRHDVDKVNMPNTIANNDNDHSYLLWYANNTGDSPLLAAAPRGNVEIYESLLNSMERGTKCKPLRCDNKAGDTPLKVAVAGGHESTVKMLLKAEEASNKSNHSDTDKDNYCVDRKNNLGSL